MRHLQMVATDLSRAYFDHRLLDSSRADRRCYRSEQLVRQQSSKGGANVAMRLEHDLLSRILLLIKAPYERPRSLEIRGPKRA